MVPRPISGGSQLLHNKSNKFRRAGEVAISVHTAESAVFGQAAQEGIGLHGALGVKDDGGVGERLVSGCQPA